jgi:hypothetical protein
MGTSSDKSWWSTIIAAVIGAAATIVAALAASATGAVHISISDSSPVSVAATSKPVPTVTVTVPSPGGSVTPIGAGGPPPSLVRNLSAPLSNLGQTGIELDKGQVFLGGTGNISYEADGSTGNPEISLDQALAWSTDVDSQNASRQQCATATTEDPDANHITNIHKGLLFCVQVTDNAFALVEVTQNLAGQKTLHLVDTYWEDPSQ